jgi:hypothetical protein
VRIAEGGTFSFEDVGSYDAFRLEGRLGSSSGEGMLSYTFLALTDEEQAQVSTTGDLTWTVEYVRTITRPGSEACSRDLGAAQGNGARVAVGAEPGSCMGSATGVTTAAAGLRRG